MRAIDERAVARRLRAPGRMKDLGLFTLRMALGGLLAGHGAQKLFGVFEGHGLEGTGNFFEAKLGLRPGKEWAFTAGAGEFTGGVLTALGLMHPLGPIATMAPMIVAWRRAHAELPIWNQTGGAELPLTNLAIATALTLTGPGKFALDRSFAIRVPMALSMLAAGGLAVGVLKALSQPEPEPEPQPRPEQQAQTSAEWQTAASTR
jgi:putative oxidoreductase